jgi:plasmid maintenance system killer protein
LVYFCAIMLISFSKKKFERECNNARLMHKRHGEHRAKLLGRRLFQLKAAPSLKTFYPPNSGPARCHELTGDKKGIFSVDLDHPYRLLFRPTHNPLPIREEGGIDWAMGTAIEIIGVEDTHG